MAEKAADDVAIETLLAELTPGMRVQIHRIDPRWCDGILATWEVDAEVPIDVEAIRHEFGGRRLAIKTIGADGKFKHYRQVKFPDPPRENGRRVYSPEEQEERERAQQPQVDPYKSLEGVFDKMVSMNQTASDTVNKFMMDRMGRLEDHLLGQRTQPPAPTNGNTKTGIEQVKESMETLAQLNTLRQDILGDVGEGEEKESNVAEKMLTDFFDLQMKKEKMKMDAAMDAHKQRMQPAPPIGKPGEERSEKPTEQKQTFENDSKSVHDLSDIELAVLAKERFNKLPQEQQEAMLSVFLGEYELQEVGGDGDDERDDDNASASARAPEPVSSGQPDGNEVGSSVAGVDLTPEDAATVDGSDDPA